MPGAQSPRQPRRREGAGAGAEQKAHHEVFPGLRLCPRRAAAAAAAAAAAGAGGRRRLAAPRRLLGGGRAGRGGGGAESGAARQPAAGAAAARPGRGAAGRGGYCRTAPHGPAAAASGQGATKPLRVSPQMCEKFTVCQNSMEMLLRNNLNLPKVTEEDGCLLAGFNEARNSSPFCSNPVYLGQVLPAQKNCGS